MKEAFVKFRASLLAEIFKQKAYKQARAFGTFEAFVKSDASAEITDDRFVQYGTPYTTALDVGRKGATLRSDIYDWLALKKYGLDWQKDSERKSLAFLIARKIEKEGSWKMRKPDQRTQIIETAIKNATPTLFDALRSYQTATVNSQVQTEINKINGNS